MFHTNCDSNPKERSNCWDQFSQGGDRSVVSMPYLAALDYALLCLTMPYHALLGSLRRDKESSRSVPSPDLTGLLFGAYFYLPRNIHSVSSNQAATDDEQLSVTRGISAVAVFAWQFTNVLARVPSLCTSVESISSVRCDRPFVSLCSVGYRESCQ